VVDMQDPAYAVVTKLNMIDWNAW